MSFVACLLKNEPASVSMSLRLNPLRDGAIGKPSVNSASVAQIRPEAV